MNKTEQFRKRVDQFMLAHPHSPLSADLQMDFTGLFYFPVNERWKVVGTAVFFPDNAPPFIMETTSGEKQIYKRLARVTFEVDGIEAEITLFTNPGSADLFVPFRDKTSGKESYGAGRYLDSHRPGVRQLPNGRFELDFNYAYNPYCAYDDTYSCPLPPTENWLPIPINAGEKSFK